MSNVPKLFQGIRKSRPKSKKANKDIPDPYIAVEKLVKAVQYAQTLGRPLLLKGEPGCGKTRLAEAVAYELFGKNYKRYYFEWHVKSNSKAQEGLYVIDYLQRLQNANIKKEGNLDITLPSDEFEGDYIKLGELGKAFRISNSIGEDTPPPVVLIDEIDKADIDFPNDLLLELDKLTFTINEAKDEEGEIVTITANKDKKPLIIITSNDEKPLPPAFLRRCLFHFIDFPGSDQLFDILKSRDFPSMTQAHLQSASRLFTGLRAAIEEQGTATKNITTSELLDWVTLINQHHRNTNKLFDITDEKSVLEFLREFGSALAKDKATSDMLTDDKKSISVIKKIIESYNKQVNKTKDKSRTAG
jgi:MoxR-like ATPase